MNNLHRTGPCRQFMARHLPVIILCVGLAVIAVTSVFRFVLPALNGRATIQTASALTDAINISELSTAEFKYRGIADIYTDESSRQIRCRVCYNAIVKAGIDMQKVRFAVDQEHKTYTAALPEIDLKVTIIDEKSMALLPSDADVELGVMLQACKADAENEARNSADLISTAQENLKKSIEGLLYPILKAEGFSLIWN